MPRKIKSIHFIYLVCASKSIELLALNNTVNLLHSRNIEIDLRSTNQRAEMRNMCRKKFLYESKKNCIDPFFSFSFFFKLVDIDIEISIEERETKIGEERNNFSSLIVALILTDTLFYNWNNNALNLFFTT